MAIPLTDVRAQYAPLLDELKDRIAEVLDSGSFILGPEVKAFEEEAARFLGVGRRRRRRQRHGRARHRPRRARSRARRRGHLPVLHLLRHGRVDRPPRRDARLRRHRPGHAQPRPSGRRHEGVTERTKAILPVHLFGRPCDPAALPDGVPVVEDAAQAFGARVGDRRAGSLAAAATFSFYPTQEPVRARRRRARHDRRLRAGGSRSAPPLPRVARQADVRRGRLQLAPGRAPGGGARASFSRHVDEWNEAPARRGGALRRAGSRRRSASCPPTSPATSTTCTSSARVERERLTAALDRPDIGWAAYYTTPLHLQPALAELGYEQGSLPRDRAGRPGDPGAPDLARHLARAAGAGRRVPAGGLDREGRLMRTLNRHRLWQAVVDAGLVALAWILAFNIRFDYGDSAALPGIPRLRRDPRRRRREDPHLHRLRPLRPLVALRLDPRHLALPAGGHRRVRHRGHRALFPGTPCRASGSRAGSSSSTG